jgi:hypothetical protein
MLGSRRQVDNGTAGEAKKHQFDPFTASSETYQLCGLYAVARVMNLRRFESERLESPEIRRPQIKFDHVCPFRGEAWRR